MQIPPYDIKPEHVIAYAKAMGFQYPADSVPKIEDHEAAINSFAKAYFDQFYTNVVNEVVKADPTVIVKEQELALAKKTAGDAIKPADLAVAAEIG